MVRVKKCVQARRADDGRGSLLGSADILQSMFSWQSWIAWLLPIKPWLRLCHGLSAPLVVQLPENFRGKTFNIS